MIGRRQRACERDTDVRAFGDNIDGAANTTVGDAGFTLVELLVALVAGGLLLAILSGMAGGFAAELNRASGTDDVVRQIASATAVLEPLLATATPAAASDDQLDVAPDRLTAQVDPPLAWRGAGPLMLDLTVGRETGGETLDLSLRAREGKTLRNLIAPERLVRGMRSIRFEQGDEEHGRLVTISFTAPNGETWPVAFEPRISSTGACVFDPISMTCRR